MIRMTMLVLMLIATAAPIPASTPGGPTWYGFNEGLAKAEAENKEVIIDFYTDWCHWCKVMDEKTFGAPEVAERLKERYICIRINAEQQDEVIMFKGQQFTPVTFTRAFGVTGFPSLAFLDKQQQPVTIIPGYVPPETFLPILKYMNQECYRKQITLDEYIKKEKNGDGCGDTK